MTTLKERAEEYAAEIWPPAEGAFPALLDRARAVAKTNYLAGVRAALEMAAHKAAQKTAMLPSDSDYARGYAIAHSDMCNEIRALLPDDASEPERTS